MASAWLTTSWDDGHPLDMRIAELLARNNLTGTFYIPRSAATGVMSEAQIRELSQTFEIGGHTLDHLFLITIDDHEAQQQISGCRKWVQDTTGQSCDMFCPPAGQFSPPHVRMIRESGFSGLRSVELLSTLPPQPIDCLMWMGTTLQAFVHRRRTYLKNTIKRCRWSSLWRYISMGAPFGWEGPLERLLEDVVQRGGVFHLWGHSWEIETTGQWNTLERVLSKMGQYTSRAPCVTNGPLCNATQPLEPVRQR